MTRDYEYVVVGLGGIGSAAAYWLARRAGSEVLGLEQFEIGHHRGASQDHSRIARLSYHTPGYVELAKGAFEAWAALESDAERALIVRTGGLDLWPPRGPIAMSDYTSSMDGSSVYYEVLDAGEIMTRWPQFRLSDDISGLYQDDAGIAPAALCNETHVAMARAHGATLLEHSRVDSLRAVEGEIEVAVGDRRLRCRKVVVAADAWSNELLSSLGVELPLTITQEQVTYFATPNLDEFAPDRFPIWIWMDDPSFYGFPVYGEQGTKAGQDVGGREVTAHSRDFNVDGPALERVTSWLERHLPSSLGPIIYTKSCLYTMPPDRDFIIDELPDERGVVVVQGAAHGFKFASLLGRIASELAVEGRSTMDIGRFRIDRPLLAMADPPKSFLV